MSSRAEILQKSRDAKAEKQAQSTASKSRKSQQGEENMAKRWHDASASEPGTPGTQTQPGLIVES